MKASKNYLKVHPTSACSFRPVSVHSTNTSLTVDHFFRCLSLPLCSLFIFNEKKVCLAWKFYFILSRTKFEWLWDFKCLPFVCIAASPTRDIWKFDANAERVKCLNQHSFLNFYFCLNLISSIAQEGFQYGALFTFLLEIKHFMSHFRY